MSPTSYQTAPPRSLMITADQHQVKPLERDGEAVLVCKVQPLARSVRLSSWSKSTSREVTSETTQRQATLFYGARYSQIAFIIPGAVVVGLLVGKLLDYWFHTHWLFLVGIIVGAIAGFVDVIQTVLRDKDLKSG